MKYYSIYFLSFCIALSSCNSQKAVVSSEQIAKNEISRNYPLFFNAENARVLGKSKEALQLYSEYVKKYPNNATASYNLARLQLQKMDLTLAEKNASHAVRLNPDNRYFQELYTQILAINKKTKLAEEQYDLLIKKYPQDDEYIYDKAVLHIMAKEYNKALINLNELEKRMGFNEDIIIQKKNIYLKQGETDLAIKEIEKLRQEDYNSSKYDIIIADIYSDANRQDKVSQTFIDIEKKYPNDPMAQVALAQYYMEKNNTVKYNYFMQKVMKNKNLDVDAKITLIIPALKKLETDTVHRDEIVNMAKSIAEESDNNKDARSLYADVLYFSRKYDQALIEYNKYLDLDKNKFSVWSQVISIYSERQQLDSVISYSKKCIEVFPKNPLPYFYAGITYVQKKEQDLAITYLVKGIPLEKENKALLSQFYSSLGDVYNTKKDFILSDSCFEEAIKLQPSDAGTLNNYAYYLSLRKQRLDEAEKMSKRSLELQPTSKSFLDTYGWILFQQGNYNEALIYIQKAINSNGQEDGTLFEHLGDVYFRLGQQDKANQNWKKAKENGEENPILLKKIKDGIYYE
jgi:tetratricopeptide (TPR) repeat protein